MTVRWRTAWSGQAIIALVVAACSAGPGAFSPTPTLNPNQQARLSQSPTPIPTSTGAGSPSGPPSQRPSPTPYAPDLEALLPSELRGIPLQRFSLPGAAVGTTGDMCSMVCPGEPHALARALGVDVDQIDLAVAVADDDVAGFPRVVIVAYRVRGVATEGLVAARIESLHREGMPRVAVDLTIARKKVTWASYSLLASAGTTEYLYAHDGVLFRVIDGVDRQPGVVTPPDTVLAIEALP